MTLAEIEALLEEGLNFVKVAAPMVGPLGGPAGAAVGAAVGQVAGLAATIIPQIETDATIIASGDLTKIKALQTQLEAENAVLNAQVQAS